MSDERRAARALFFLSQSSVFFSSKKRDKIERQNGTRVDDDSVGMQRVKHNLAGDAKEVRKGGKMKLQECAAGRQCGPSNLHRVPTLWKSNRLKIHRGPSRRRRFLRHALKKKNSLEHCRATDNTTLSYISLRMSTLLFMMLVRSVVESAGSLINEVWLERYFRAVETFSVNRDDVSVGDNANLTLACFHCRFEHCMR